MICRKLLKSTHSEWWECALHRLPWQNSLTMSSLPKMFPSFRSKLDYSVDISLFWKLLHYYLPLLFAIIICHYYLPLLFAIIICHYYLPLLFAIICHYYFQLLFPNIGTGIQGWSNGPLRPLWEAEPQPHKERTQQSCSPLIVRFTYTEIHAYWTITKFRTWQWVSHNL